MQVLTLSRTRSRALIALLVIAAAASIVPAIGDASPRTTAVTVSFSGIDTSTEAGVQALYRRIRSAAEDACGPEFRSPRLTRLRNECVDDAISAAVADANRSLLSALHQRVTSRTGP